MRQHEFTEPQFRIVDLVLFFSLERGRPQALIPRQSFIGQLLRLSKSKVSEEIDFLERAAVLEVSQFDPDRKGHRPWYLFALRPPEGWLVPPRVRDSAELQELEGWLEVLDSNQPDLLPAPPTLADKMRETFVENAAAKQSPAAVSSQVGRAGSSQGNIVRVEQPGNQAESNEVPPGGTMVESEVPPGRTSAEFQGPEVPPGRTWGGASSPRENSGRVEVPPGGTSPLPEFPQGELPSRARVDRSIDRLIESRSTSSRSGSISIDRARAQEVPPRRTQADPSSPRENSDHGKPSERTQAGEDYRSYVRDYFYRIVGEREKHGRSSALFDAACDRYPNEVDTLVGVLKEQIKLGRVQNPGAWMNRSIRNLYEEIRVREGRE